MSEGTLVFIDDGFLAKLSKYFGGGKYLKFDRILFAKNLTKKQNLNCEHIFYYVAPPFKSEKPTKEEAKRYRDYRNFVSKISQSKIISIREGRCQRLKINGEFVYKQKAVDSLAIMDLLSVPIDYPKIKTIILIASDSDFVPVVEKLKKAGIKVILYIYYIKKRDTGLSRSNYLMQSVSKYVKLTKEDFDNAPLNKEVVEIKKALKKNKKLEFVLVKCSFLSESNLCVIYKNRPKCCRNYATKTKSCVSEHVRKKCLVFSKGDCNMCGYCCKNIRWPKSIPLTKKNFLSLHNIECKDCPFYKEE